MAMYCRKGPTIIEWPIKKFPLPPPPPPDEDYLI
jgi:hypothetical protein